MTLGPLYDQVAFRRVGRTRRADGGYDTTPSTLSTVYAEVRPVAANEREQSGRLVGETSYMVRIHAADLPADLSTDDAVQWVSNGNMQLNIRSIRRPAARVQFVEIVADAGVNA